MHPALIALVAALFCSCGAPASAPARIASPAPQEPAAKALPDYAAPVARTPTPDELRHADLIRYRALSREDFKANSLPTSLEPHATRLGALTCTHVAASSATITGERDPASGRWKAHLSEVQFVAHMDRSCSWWNPNSLKDEEAYALEHEQIHFALAELAARREHLRANQQLATFQGEGDTQDAARQAVQRLLAQALGERLKLLTKVNRQFDEETSLKRDPDAQRRWRRRVERDLAALPRPPLPPGAPAPARPKSPATRPDDPHPP